MKDINTKPFSLIRDVVSPGFCIGCGICKTVEPYSINIEFNEFGFYQAVLQTEISQEVSDKIERVCPFSSNADNETLIGTDLYSNHATWDDKLGYVTATYAIRVNEGGYREQATSGGFTSWVACQLLEKGLIDAVVHVGASDELIDGEPYFEYKISTSVQEIKSRSKTRYYPVEIGTVLSKLENDSRRFAVIGLPCFVKGVQLLRRSSPEWHQRIPFTISIFCGHLKSKLFTENLIHSIKGDSANIKALDYRRKLEGNPANVYIMGVQSTNGDWLSKNMDKIPASDWGSGAFKYYACNFCDDVVGETSDVSVGDVWLPKYRVDGGGTNNVVVRNPIIDSLISQALSDGKLWVDPLSIEDVHASTKGGFEDRRLGTAYRVQLETSSGNRPPKKRAEVENSSVTKEEILAFKMWIGLMTPQFYLTCKRFHLLWFFHGVMKLIILSYKRRFPGFLFRSKTFSQLVTKRRKNHLEKISIK